MLHLVTTVTQEDYPRIRWDFVIHFFDSLGPATVGERATFRGVLSAATGLSTPFSL
jgi:hypothetical protein